MRVENPFQRQGSMPLSTPSSNNLNQYQVPQQHQYAEPHYVEHQQIPQAIQFEPTPKNMPQFQNNQRAFQFEQPHIAGLAHPQQDHPHYFNEESQSFPDFGIAYAPQVKSYENSHIPQQIENNRGVQQSRGC